jgi:hypothetical protein
MTMPDEVTATVFVNSAPQIVIETGEIDAIVAVESIDVEVIAWT